MPISVYCQSCQQDFDVNDELVGQTVECPICQVNIRVSEPTGKLLAKVAGQEPVSMAIAAVVGLIVVFIFLIGGFFVFPEIINNEVKKASSYNIGGSYQNYKFDQLTNKADDAINGMKRISIIAIIILSIFTGLQIMIINRIRKTYLRVYDDRLEGCGHSNTLLYTVTNFLLPYNKITSIATNKNVLIIVANNTKYKCFVQNPDQIRNVIYDQQKQIGNINS